MSAQVARLEELLARVQRNRLRLAEETTEAPVEMPETAAYEEADIDTAAESDTASIAPTPPAESERQTLVVTEAELIRQTLVVTEAEQIRQTLVADVIPLEPDVEDDEPAPMDDIVPEPEPIPLTVSARVSSAPPPAPPFVAAESRVFAPEITATGPVVQVRQPLEETSWTLSAVLDRAWWR